MAKDSLVEHVVKSVYDQLQPTLFTTVVRFGLDITGLTFEVPTATEAGQHQREEIRRQIVGDRSLVVWCTLRRRQTFHQYAVAVTVTLRRFSPMDVAIMRKRFGEYQPRR